MGCLYNTTLGNNVTNANQDTVISQNQNSGPICKNPCPVSFIVSSVSVYTSLSPSFSLSFCALILLTFSDLSAGITTLFSPQCPSLIEANKDQLKSLRAFLKRALATKCISRLSLPPYILRVSLSPSSSLFLLSMHEGLLGSVGARVFPGSHQ